MKSCEKIKIEDEVKTIQIDMLSKENDVLKTIIIYIEGRQKESALSNVEDYVMKLVDSNNQITQLKNLVDLMDKDKDKRKQK